MKNKHPKYLERFSEICAQVGTNHLNCENRERYNNATWEIAIYAYNVTRKEFQSASRHLAKVEHLLNDIHHELTSDEEIETHTGLNKLKRFTKNLRQKYHQFLEKNGISKDHTIF